MLQEVIHIMCFIKEKWKQFITNRSLCETEASTEYVMWDRLSGSICQAHSSKPFQASIILASTQVDLMKIDHVTSRNTIDNAVFNARKALSPPFYYL